MWTELIWIFKDERVRRIVCIYISVGVLGKLPARGRSVPRYGVALRCPNPEARGEGFRKDRPRQPRSLRWQLFHHLFDWTLILVGGIGYNRHRNIIIITCLFMRIFDNVFYSFLLFFSHSVFFPLSWRPGVRERPTTLASRVNPYPPTTHVSWIFDCVRLRSFCKHVSYTENGARLNKKPNYNNVTRKSREWVPYANAYQSSDLQPTELWHQNHICGKDEGTARHCRNSYIYLSRYIATRRGQTRLYWSVSQCV